MYGMAKAQYLLQCREVVSEGRLTLATDEHLISQIITFSGQLVATNDTSKAKQFTHGCLKVSLSKIFIQLYCLLQPC